jgi:hypothetical protein
LRNSQQVKINKDVGLSYNSYCALIKDGFEGLQRLIERAQRLTLARALQPLESVENPNGSMN